MLTTCTFAAMGQNFTKRIRYNGKTVLAVIIPQHRKDGQYFEINIIGLPRFYMKWTSFDRYDIADNTNAQLPYELILAVSDAIESMN